MTQEEAEEILGRATSVAQYYFIMGETGKACVDGKFSAEELEAIACILRCGDERNINGQRI